MSEGRSNIDTRGTIVDDAVVMFVGNKVFSGWKSVSISRKINSIANSFTFEMTDKWQINQEPVEIVRGQRAHIHIGKTSVLDGFVDSVDFSIDGSTRSVTVSGRSKTADLVDCSYVGPSQFKESTMENIVAKILAPFNVKSLFRSPGGTFTKLDIRQGETVGEIISRMAREKNLIIYSSFNGNLVFEKNGSTRAKTEITQGVNLLSGSVSRDNSDRFSEYIVKSQKSGALVGGAEDTISNEGKSTDAGINRYRPMLITSENSTDANGALKRAAYEASVRAAKAEQFTIGVQGWFQKGTELWNINQIVALDAPYLKHKGDLLIDGVTFSKNDSGTLAILNLVRPDAYQFNPTVKKSKADKDAGLVGG